MSPTTTGAPGESVIVDSSRLTALSNKISEIMSALSTTVYGVSLLDNPVGFVAAAVIDLVIKWVMMAAGAVGWTIRLAIDQVILGLRAAGGGAAEPVIAIGSMIEGGAYSFGDTVVAWFAGLGAASPWVALLVVFLSMYLIANLIESLVGFARSRVIPP